MVLACNSVWDVFVCHAREDHDAVARPLAELLREKELTVWLDANVLTLGDVLSKKIDDGLVGSRFGVVILSRHFFAKRWTQHELSGLVEKEIDRGKVILPIWHGVDRDFIMQYSPTLAAKVAVSTSQGLPFVANEILRALQVSECDVPLSPEQPPPLLTKAEWAGAQLRSTQTEIQITRNITQFNSEEILEVMGKGMPSPSVRLDPGRTITFRISPGAYEFRLGYTYSPSSMGTGSALGSAGSMSRTVSSNSTGMMSFQAGRYMFECTDVPAEPIPWWEEILDALLARGGSSATFRLELVGFEPWPELVRAGLVPLLQDEQSQVSHHPRPKGPLSRSPTPT